jgi:hypothetical protein
MPDNLPQTSLLLRPKRRKSPADFLETLGKFSLEPIKTLEHIRLRPDLSQAALAVVLALLGRTLAHFLEQGGVDTGPAALKEMAAGLAGGLCLWVFVSGFWHLASRLLKKEGEFKPFLCLIGWSAAVHWADLPLRLFQQTFPSAAWIFSGFLAVVQALFLFLAHQSLKLHYGWTGTKALAVLFLPFLLVFLLVLLLAAFFTASFLTGALFSKFGLR